MNQAQHTQGEWRAGGIYVECNNTVLAVVDSNETACRERRKRAPLLDEAWSNARMMAAAPDLLEALKSSIEMMLEMGRVIRHLDEGEHSEFWTQDEGYIMDSRFNQARAAIEKATGKP